MADSKITALTELTAPASADLLAIVDDVAGTATTKKVEIDSLDDYFSASTKTLTNKTLTSPLYQGLIDGWTSANETWTYASASTITVPSGAAAKYAKGDKLKLTQAASVKYFYVIGVADTVLTITGGTDYTLTNATISANYYSHESTPIGFPGYINLSTWNRLSISGGTATVSGWSYITGNTNSPRGGTLNFSITFGAAPVVTVSLIGYKNNAQVPAAITEFVHSNQYQVGDSEVVAHNITTTACNYTIAVGAKANWTTSVHLGVSFIAIGTL